MGGYIAELAIAVAGGGDDLSVADKDGADRDFAARTRRFGFLQRTVHEACTFSVHSLHHDRFDRTS